MIGIGLKLLGVASKIKSGIAWVFASPKRIAIAALILLFVFMSFRMWMIDRDRDDWRDAAAKWENASLAWEAALNKLVVDVRLGREKAAQLDRENAARVDAEMKAIKERTANDYETALADTRRAAKRLRNQLNAAANQSGGGEAGLPGAYTARCQAFGYPDCDALLAALPGLLEAAEENTNKLIALQAWVKSVLAVDMNGIEP